MTASRGIQAAKAARTAKTCNRCSKEKPLASFRPRKMVCRDCANGPLRQERELAKGEERECGYCESVFLSPRNYRGLKIYCGKSCADAALVRSPEGDCLYCGAAILKKVTHDYVRNFCSMDCRLKHRVGPNNPTWRGGVRPSGEVRVYVGKRADFVATSWALHRSVASKYIGRPLHRAEFVLHIDQDRGNNDPANLFICASQSECRSRILGVTLGWPTHSNLPVYRARNQMHSTAAAVAFAMMAAGGVA